LYYWFLNLNLFLKNCELSRILPYTYSHIISNTAVSPDAILVAKKACPAAILPVGLYFESASDLYHFFASKTHTASSVIRSIIIRSISSEPAVPAGRSPLNVIGAVQK
jgi:hypothetical protein